MMNFSCLQGNLDQWVGTPLDRIQWMAVLKSASAYEMYRKCQHRIMPTRIAEFLILDRQFPRSIHFCLWQAEPVQVSQFTDLDGNAIAKIWFQGVTEHLKVQVTTEVETYRTNPFDYLLEPWATTLPIDYSSSLLRLSINRIP